MASDSWKLQIMQKESRETSTVIVILSLKVTVHIGTDQNIEIEIFAE